MICELVPSGKEAVEPDKHGNDTLRQSPNNGTWSHTGGGDDGDCKTSC